MKRRMLLIVASSLLLAVGAIPAQAGVLPGQLQISELMPNPNTPIDSDGEWIELRNATAVNLDMGLIRLQDAFGNFFEMAPGRIITPGAFFLFVRQNNPANGGIVIWDYQYGGALSLNNSGTETISLFSDGVLIDSVSYTGTIAGVSLNFTDDGASYRSTNLFYPPFNHYGSPGSANEILAAIPEPETYALLLAGLGLLGFSAARRRSPKA
jgi:hypothetical protein